MPDPDTSGGMVRGVSANGRDCKHGQLARSCEICDLEEEVAELRHQVETCNQEKMRQALLALQGWDMLSLTPDGQGVATADAPWARKLIADALEPAQSGRSDEGEA